MSSIYNSTPPSVDAQRSREYVDEFGFPHHQSQSQSQSELNLLSPYNSQTISSSTSPSYNVQSTPGGLSEYSAYQPSELSEVEDPFFGVDFDAGVTRVDSLSSALFNQTYHSIQSNPPLANAFAHTSTEAEDIAEPLSATTSTYPLSPVHSTHPNTPSPHPKFNEIKSNSTISQHELPDFYNTPYNPNVPPQVHFPSTVVQLTPDHSGSSHSSGEESEPGSMSRVGQSPIIAVSQWESMHPEHHSPYVPQISRKRSSSNAHEASGQLPAHVERDENGSWRPDATTGQAGIDPESRKEISNTLVPNLKEAEEQRRIDSANLEIQEWRSQADTHDPDEKRDGSFFPSADHIWDQSSGRHVPREVADIAPADDDSASERENKPLDGQIYYNFKHVAPNEADFRLMQQSRHWSDAPAMPHITKSNFQQPATANDAIRKYNERSDAQSIISRAATWGTYRTRRHSDPSVADWESVQDGNFLKKLSISKPKETGRNRSNSIFDQGLDRLANFARKRSDSRLKRARSSVNIPEAAHTTTDPRKNSQDTLAPPPHTPNYNPRGAPSINTTIAAMAGTISSIGTTHARSGSVSGPTISPKSPQLLGGLSNFVKRARSKSELASQEKAAQPGIATMWRRDGGPPIAKPATVPDDIPVSAAVEVELRQPEEKDLLEEDDDEDDDFGDENDPKVEEEVDPIVPNYEGFKAHVRRLNPDMEHRYNWLVSRVAHQQEIRYKNLLEMRVKHSQAVFQRNCQAGRHCVSLGGNATLLDTKGHPLEPERGPHGLQIVTDLDNDSDSNPGEGALTDETFPQGVPKPPTRNLPAEFECQLCFKAKKFQKPSDWTKHVHEDVQPFTCTYDKCKEPKSFKRKADWVRHENERHRHLEWWVCQVDDCRHPCYRKDNFLQHLVREHKLPEPKQKTKAAIKKARTAEMAWIMLDQCHHETQNRPQDEPCKFCGKTFATWKKLTVHLAKHMEHISLPILKLVEARVVDADTIISPVEQIITPITPAKLEHSPFSMNNISPHGNMGHFQPYDQRPYYGTSVSSAPYLPSQVPQQQMFTHNMFQNNFGNHSMEQPRGFPSMAPTNHIDHTRTFGSLDSSFAPVKIEQSRFGSIDSNYHQMIPEQNFNHLPQNGYVLPQNSMPQNFSSAPAVSGYQTSNMQVSDGGNYNFVPMAVNAAQPYDSQIPMSRAPGSGSSYGHHSPPQHMDHSFNYNNHQ